MKERPLHIHLTSVDSTNHFAKRALSTCALAELTVISADRQTAGRGQFNRKWSSPPGNLYLTFCFRTARLDPTIGLMCSTIAALSLENAGFFVEIRPPNDLLIKGKKVAGVLCETFWEGGELWNVAGLGLNLNMGKEELAAIDQPATALVEERGQTASCREWKKQIVERFTHAVKLWKEEGFAPFQADYERLLIQVGNHNK